MSRRRCTSAIALGAIVFLCALVITVWVQFSQGAFDRHRPNHVANSKPMAHTSQSTTKSTAAMSEDSLHLSEHKKLIEKTHLDENLGSQDVLIVRPLKINPDDENQPIGSLGQSERHHSGQFRDKSAEIWDPHPKYEIDISGRKLLLKLEQDNKFLAPQTAIRIDGKDFAHLLPHDPKIAGCHYTGKIENDSNSLVAVSLCHGMTGYIRSSWANYYIEPAENFTSGSLKSILHRLKIVPHGASESNNITKSEKDYNDGSPSIIDDDFPEDVLEAHHSVKKRYATFADDSYYDYQRTNEMISNSLYPNLTKGYVKQSKEYFIKVLIVADNTMLEHHGTHEKLTEYILILMAYVALLFKEPSIGNAINVSLVHIRIVNYRADDFFSSKSTDMLQKFCDWQHYNIQQHFKNNKAYDIALLLTRRQICKSPDSCSTLGVAQVSSMCASNSCTVVRDKGLSTSYTIAHEFGHTLSMLHDEDTKCMSHNFGTFHTNNIMSRSTSNDSKPYMWSPCSRQYVTDFLDSPKSKCLLHPPFHDEMLPNYTQMLPGDSFELDRQCELEFGQGQTRCTMAHIYNPPCVHMWCKNVNGKGCINNYSPWAEGTKCGSNSWCYKRQCVSQDRNNIIPVDGGWSDWQPWGPCSRTCGGGIKKSERLCNNPIPANGGNYCTGQSVKYISCNSQNCDDNAVDFREIQCAQFNGITKGVPNLAQNVHWVPKYNLGFSDGSEDNCRLYCKPNDSQAYYNLKDKVIDGTKCGKSGFGICVNGICRPGGCDNVMDSTMAPNECGICGGDNSQCRLMNGTYNATADQVTYKTVVRIPKGSSNIQVVQYSAGIDENFLALRDGETGKFILNGNQMLRTQEMELEYGHVTIRYSGSKEQIEWISTTKRKKLQKDLVVEVLSIKNLSPPNITYQYMISNDAAPKYGWTLYEKSWTKCSSICEGLQYKRPVCVDLVNNQEVHSSYCNLNEKESATQKRECNSHCTLTWHVVSKSACSPSCGNGYRHVDYKCMKIVKNYDAENVDNQHCNVLPKPPSTETCYICNTTRWEYTNISDCSKICNGGILRRTAKCVDKDGIPVDDSHCNEDEKQVEIRCNSNVNCPDWKPKISPCSVPCGGGNQNVTYYCVLGQKEFHESNCDQRTKPPSTLLPCNEHSCVRWAPTDFFYPCTVTCGKGVERRRYVCKKFDSEDIIVSEYCRSLRAPREDTRKCFKKCPDPYSIIPRINNDIEIDYNRRSNHIARYRTFQWIPGEWSQCSQTCGGGITQKSFICRNEMGDEDIQMCDPHQKPNSIKRCNDRPCPIWKVGDWSPVCDSMCERHRQVRCMNDKMETFDDRQCDQQRKPEDTTKCRLVECPHATNNLTSTFFSKGDQQKRYRWRVKAWKECSTKCGTGIRLRDVECEDSLNNSLVGVHLCKHKTRPKNSKGCERYKCKYTWIQGYWSSCSETCGYGIKTRNVTCHKVHQGIVEPTPLPESYCDTKSKPSLTDKCLLSYCGDEYIWHTGEWQRCSKTCGKKGRQFRKLSCINARTRTAVPPHFCPKSLRPARKRKCNQWRCLYKSCSDIKRYTKTRENKDYVILLHGRAVNVYCYKMDTPEPQEYISLHPDMPNYAEIYDRRLLNLNSCPYGGNRRDNCHCDQIGPDRSGMTKFWKIRLNITSMQIIGDDFTFSKQVKGTKIPYGTAGDCYSSTSACPQGKFSVNLKQTSFKLANYIKWRETGRYSSRPNIQKDRKDTIVLGKCGGYCGGCEPDPDYGGLKVEVT